MNNKKLIIAFIMSFVMFVSMYFQKITEGYNFILVLFFVLYTLFIYKTDFSNKKNFKFMIFVSLALSLIFFVGRTCYILRYNAEYSIWNDIFKARTIIYLFGYFSLFCPIIMRSINYLDNVNVYSENKKINHIWLKTFLIIFISSDSITEISLIINNFANISNHHPVIHVLFCSIPFKIGMAIFNNTTIATACISFTQMTIMAGIYSYFIVFLNKHKVNKKILIIMSIIFGLLPVYAFFSLSMWKDVLFGGFFLLFMINIYTLIERQDNLRIYHYISFVIISLLVLFFRNNALYMYIIFVPFIIIYLKKHFKYIAPSVLIVFIVFFTIKYPVYNHLGVERSKSWEYLGIPIQQVGRMAYKNVKFTKEEKTEIEKFITIENLKKDYNPRVSDGIKFSLNLNQEYFETNNKEFLKLWSHLVVKHFDVAVETYFVSTLGYWYPNLENNAVEIGVTKNNIDLYSNPLVPEKINKFINNLYSYNTPFLSLQWNLQFYWVLLVLRKIKNILYVIYQL